MKPETKYVTLLTAIYFIASLIGILHHELWLDEAHHWLLARDSHSIPELIANTRLEGHPLIWSLLLYGITRFSIDPVYMQLLHIAISTLVVYLFLRKAPFSWVFKVLFIFGYFMLFEYNLISRNYILGILFLFLACSIFKDRDKKFALLCLYLILASNIHLVFSVIAFALFLTLLFERFQNKTLNFGVVVGCVIFVLGMGFIVMQTWYTDSSWLLDPINQLSFTERIGKGYISLFKGLFPIPDFRTHYFWNSNLIVNLSRPLAAVLALLAYFIPLLLFFKNRKTLYFVYATLIGVQIFFFVTQRAAMRFYGLTYVAVIMGLWIETYYASESYKLKDWLQSLKLTLFKKSIIYTILVIHFCCGIYAWTIDYKYPFTSAKETVEFLKKKGLASREIITVTCDGTIISAYLGRKIWFLCENGYHSYCQWNLGCAGKISPEQNAGMISDYMETHSNAIFVSYYSLSNSFPTNNEWTSLDKKVEYRFLKSKFDVNVADKGYMYVFEIRKKQLAHD